MLAEGLCISSCSPGGHGGDRGGNEEVSTGVKLGIGDEDGVEVPEDLAGKGSFKALGDTEGKEGVFELFKDLELGGLGSMGDGGPDRFANNLGRGLFIGSGLFRDISLATLSSGALGSMGDGGSMEDGGSMGDGGSMEDGGPECFPNLKRALFFFSGLFRDSSVTKPSILNPGSSSATKGEVRGFGSRCGCR